MRAATFNEKGQVWEQVVEAKEWYSVRDVCTILAAGGPSVYGAIRRGTLKAYRVNGATRVKHDDLVIYIARRATGPSLAVGELVIEEIIPQREAQKAAQRMAPETEFSEGEDLSFLDE